MPKQKPAAGHIRIIAGQWRRCQLPVLAHTGLRPSSDRVRETVFNWLNHLWGGQFSEKKIIDAFAGTGAFGLECISRGARAVTLIDAHIPAINAIRQILTHWEKQDPSVAQARAIAGDALNHLSQCAQAKQTFDLVFLDPPFAQGCLDKTLPLLPPLCHADSLLYVEAEKGANLDALIQQGWTCLREGTTQQVYYSVWRRLNANT
ncbi:MAG: RsmD family RNA methyltransferase [Burkholderiales bacterium]|nr:RsmD family RNA methyltransferase [Burkholderiales bacterium]